MLPTLASTGLLALTTLTTLTRATAPPAIVDPPVPVRSALKQSRAAKAIAASPGLLPTLATATSGGQTALRRPAMHAPQDILARLAQVLHLASCLFFLFSLSSVLFSPFFFPSSQFAPVVRMGLASTRSQEMGPARAILVGPPAPRLRVTPAFLGTLARLVKPAQRAAMAHATQG